MSEQPPGEPRPSGLTHKLNRLFEVMHPRNRGEYTLQEVVDGITAQGGPTLSMTYLWQLRKGIRDNPSREHLEAIAQFFGVNPAYFFDPSAEARIDAQLDLFAAMRDSGVSAIALRASELPPEGQRVALNIIEQISQLQQGTTDVAPGGWDGHERRSGKDRRQDRRGEGAGNDA